MGQKLMIYSFVARGTVILAEYTEFTGNFTSIASQCLQKLPASNNKFTYNCDNHTFNYLVDDGYKTAVAPLFSQTDSDTSSINCSSAASYISCLSTASPTAADVPNGALLFYKF